MCLKPASMRDFASALGATETRIRFEAGASVNEVDLVRKNFIPWGVRRSRRQFCIHFLKLPLRGWKMGLYSLSLKKTN